jgi:hypothetical protein
VISSFGEVTSWNTAPLCDSLDVVCHVPSMT